MLVETINGGSAERNDCIKIAGEFYVKNVDVVSIDNKWYRKTNLKIYYNTIENKYMKVTNNTMSGIVKYHEDDDTFTIGKYEGDFDNRYVIKTQNGELYCASKELFDSIPKIFIKSRGAYVNLSSVGYLEYRAGADKHSNAYIYEFDRMYNSESLIPIFSSVDNSKHTDDLLSRINKSKKTYDLINKYSFGVEIETGGGVIPQHECIGLGLIPLRDGSIGGHEYTTIPMVGENGINLLMNQFRSVKEKCFIDKECSMHVHFGNFPVQEDKILRLHRLLYLLQDEIGSIFHERIFNTGSYKASGKDYCKRFSKDFRDFNSLYKYFGHADYPFKGSLTSPHPLDPNRNRKWENNCRYYFCNLINMMYGDAQKTVEFRLHTPTLNYSKVINWLFICTSILNYAESDEEISISKSLEDIISYSNDSETAELLNGYISKRRTFFKSNKSKYGDSYGFIDILKDCDVEYKTPYHS